MTFPASFRRALLIALGLALVIAAGVYLLRQSPPIGVGQPAPAWALPDAQGRTVHLRDFRGQPALLNFWATWCFPCREEMPLLAQTAQTHPDLAVIFINEGETPTDVARFLDELDLTLPLVVYDARGAVAAQYQVQGFPTTFFLDAEGIIRAIYLGGLDEPTLNQNLRAIGVQP